MRYQDFHLVFSELEHEVVREAGEIALNRFVQVTCSHPIKLREIGIQQDLFMAKHVDERGDLFGNEKDRAFPGRGFLLGWHGDSWMKSTRFAPGVQ